MMEKRTHTYAIPMSLKARLDEIRKDLEDQNDMFKVKVTNINVIEFLVSRYEKEKDNG
jgi:hypothetical protein